MAINRITYRGAKLFINDYPIHRATAFGSTGNLNKEDLHEIGNAGLVDIVEDTPEVDITLDVNDYGSIATLALMMGKPATASHVDLSQDIEKSVCDIYASIEHGGVITRTQYIQDAYLTSFNWNYSVDGNFTESYGLAADNKTWYLNDAANISSATATVSESNNEASITASGVHAVLGVTLNGVKIPASYYTAVVDTSGATVHFNPEYVVLKSGDVVRIRYAGSGTPIPWEPNTIDVAALRKGQIEIFLLDNVVRGSGGEVVSATEIKQLRLQSVAISSSIDRENLAQLGSTRYYDRPVNFPLNIDVSCEIRDTDMELFARLVGKEYKTAKSISIDEFRNDIGLRVKLYTERDIDADVRTPIKIIDIPYLIPNDESWNVSLDANATQAFSFRTHELRVRVN